VTVLDLKGRSTQEKRATCEREKDIVERWKRLRRKEKGVKQERENEQP
jgi:hypothetical protein